jgi:hypothetical protein
MLAALHEVLSAERRKVVENRAPWFDPTLTG